VRYVSCFPNDHKRDFALQQENDPGLQQAVQRLEFGSADGTIGARNDHNVILAASFYQDARNARRQERIHRYAAEVHSVGRQPIHHVPPKGVRPHAPHQDSLGSHSGSLHRLVRTFSARVSKPSSRDNGLTLIRHTLAANNEVHVDTTE
jgi:hypothetical protein